MEEAGGNPPANVLGLQLIRDENATFTVIIVTLCLFDAVIVWLLLAK
jgi:hypothetical protein